MKLLITILLIGCQFSVFSSQLGQLPTDNGKPTTKNRQQTTIKWHDIALPFIAGFSYGTAEALKWHYHSGFKRRFPQANDQFWSPELSWPNKYKNRDPLQGPAHFGATSFLAWTRDGYHLAQMGGRQPLILKAAITIGQPFNWRQFIVTTLVVFGSHSAGFHASYTFLFTTKP